MKGRTSNTDTMDTLMPPLQDAANEWDVIAGPPGRREYPTAAKNTGMSPDIIVYSIAEQKFI